MHHRFHGCAFLATSLSALVCLVYSLAGSWPAQPSCSETTTRELIEQLGSPSFKVREAATRELMKRDEAVAPLRKAVHSPDPEVRRRAAQILEVFGPREAQRGLEKLVALAKSGEVDLVVERLVRKSNRYDKEAYWQVLAELAGRLVDLDAQRFRHTKLMTREDMPIRDFRRYAKQRSRMEIIAMPRFSIEQRDIA